MSRYDDDRWPAYVPVAERRRKAERETAKLRKKGQPVAPVRIEGRAITTTAWGNAWCDNLESYRDYESRLPRGRTYVRNGSVIDLQLGPCEVKALVSGSSIYKVKIGISPMPADQWRSIRADCAGGIESVVELLQGRLSKGVMDRMCRQGTGLFPKPSEIRFSCSCLDHASMCKHVAAVLYGVGARLDTRPELLFWLRTVDAGDLVAGLDSAALASKPAGDKVLGPEDVSALFGLDLAESDNADGVVPKHPSSRARRVIRSQPAASVLKAASAKAAKAQPIPREYKASRPARAPTAAQQGGPPTPRLGAGASTTAPTPTKKCTAVQLSGAMRLGKKEAEKLVADVVARIGKHLVTGVDVTLAGPGTPAVKARNTRSLRAPTCIATVRTPGSKKRVGRPAKTSKDAT
jgi:uncharacterized Zn finger protein/nucleoid DNA-binding protein